MKKNITMQEKKVNYWKRAFIILVTLIIILTSYIIIKLNMSSYYFDKNYSRIEKEINYLDEEYLSFETRFTEAQFNTFLKSSLTSDNNKYDLFFSDGKIHLIGKVKIIGINIPIEIEGIPNALKDGNIDIHITGVEAGSFNLPTDTVIKGFSILVPKDIPMVVDARRNVINIRLDKISEEKGIKIQAKEIDSVENKFIFELYMPKEFLKLNKEN